MPRRQRFGLQTLISRIWNRTLSQLTIAKTDVVNPQPKLTVRAATSPEWSIASDTGNPGPLIQVEGAGLKSDLRNLVVLSANPGLPGPGWS